MEPFQNSEVESVFNGYPEPLKTKLLHLRQLIFETAAANRDIGLLEETLKWGQPSYLTPKSKSGTTLRMDRIGKDERHYGLFVHCQTSLLATYRELYPDQLTYEGQRCVRFDVETDPPKDVLRHCIELALTYHRHKRKDRLPF
jgi:hypothetical protein